MEPLISVIIPVYNVEQFLPRCLDSVLAQTYRNLQILLIDDGSKDSSGEICDRYAMQDARIKVIHQPNAGVSAARNTGLQNADGAYLMFVDSDDYIAANAVEVLYERMCRDGSDCAVGKHADVCDDGEIYAQYCAWMEDAVYTQAQVLAQLEREERISLICCAKLFKKELFEGITFPPLICGEDMWTALLVLGKTGKVSTVAQTVYYYYQRATSVIHTYSERSKRDDLEANLFAVQHLLHYGVYSSAVKWYENAMLRAFWMEDSKLARQIIRSYLDRKTDRALFLRQRPKTMLLRAAVHLPLVRACIRRYIGRN